MNANNNEDLGDNGATTAHPAWGRHTWRMTVATMLAGVAMATMAAEAADILPRWPSTVTMIALAAYTVTVVAGDAWARRSRR